MLLVLYMASDNIPLNKDKPNKAIDEEERVHIYISEDVSEVAKIMQETDESTLI